MLYSDEDKISAHGQRFQPYFKPDWNPDLFLAENLVTRLCVCRTSRVNEVGGFRSGHEGAQDWDLVMRVSERTSAAHIRHVPYVLYHWRAVPGSPALAMGEKGYASAAEYRSLASQFERRGVRVEILPVAGLAWRIRYPLPQPLPLVSVIIPTRDHVELLRRCVASLRERGAYPRLEIVIVDNRSSDRAALTYLCELAAERDVTVVRHDAPFNYSALNNAGARHAHGDVLVPLNNDVEAISRGWLEEMVSQACRPEIGAVGALLYYPNDSIQHAGVVLGLGSAGIAAHAYAFRPRGYVGQSGRALLTRNVSAVTAACLACGATSSKSTADEDTSIAYNDLDLCLRIAAAVRNCGRRTRALSRISRGDDDTPAARALPEGDRACASAGAAALRNDPAYNPNSARRRELHARLPAARPSVARRRDRRADVSSDLGPRAARPLITGLGQWRRASCSPRRRSRVHEEASCARRWARRRLTGSIRRRCLQAAARGQLFQSAVRARSRRVRRAVRLLLAPRGASRG